MKATHLLFGCILAASLPLSHVIAQVTEADFVFSDGQLSNQEKYPFRLSKNEILEEGDVPWERYEEALTRFPSAKDCMESPAKNGAWDLSLFDWKSMRGNRDIEVCLFRIGATFSNAELTSLWLKRWGYSVRLDAGVEPIGKVLRVHVSGILPSEEYDKRVTFTRSLRRSVRDILLSPPARIYDHSVGFTFDSSDGTLISVYSTLRGY